MREIADHEPRYANAEAAKLAAETPETSKVWEEWQGWYTSYLNQTPPPITEAQFRHILGYIRSGTHPTFPPT